MSALFSAFQAAVREYHRAMRVPAGPCRACCTRCGADRPRRSTAGAVGLRRLGPGRALHHRWAERAGLSSWYLADPAHAAQVKAFNDISCRLRWRHSPHLAAAAYRNLVEGLRRPAVRSAAQHRVAAHGADAPLCPRLCRARRGAVEAVSVYRNPRSTSVRAERRKARTRWTWRSTWSRSPPSIACR